MEYVFLYNLRYLIYNKNIKSCRGGRLQIITLQKTRISGIFRNNVYSLTTFLKIHKTKPEKKGFGDVMDGKVLELESDKLIQRGIEQGIEQGIAMERNNKQ